MSAKETVMNAGNVKNPQITPIAHQIFTSRFGHIKSPPPSNGPSRGELPKKLGPQ